MSKWLPGLFGYRMLTLIMVACLGWSNRIVSIAVFKGMKHGDPGWASHGDAAAPAGARTSLAPYSTAGRGNPSDFARMGSAGATPTASAALPAPQTSKGTTR